MSGMAEAIEPQVRALYLRVLGGEPGQAQLWFHRAVLDRYRQPGTRIIRTNSAGRLKTGAGWSLDFGISGDDQLIHAAAADIGQRVPAADHGHWVQHLATPPASRNFLAMRLGAAACIDDGELRDWALNE
jgi:hypothetical protein